MADAERPGPGEDGAPAQQRKGAAAPKGRQPRPGAPRAVDGQPLTPEEEAVLRQLQARDRAVRAHEAAHKAVGGSLAGNMSFSYRTGPDGRQYAVGGEVVIDVAPERDPRATIAKMRQVIAAALAPADPSPQDRAVAAQAAAQMAEAQRQLLEQQRAEARGERRRGETETSGSPAPRVGASSARLVGAYGAAMGGGAVTGGLLNLIA